MKSGPQVQFNLTITPAVKMLMIANIAIWFFCQIILDHYLKFPFNKIFALYPAEVLVDFSIWQLVTYAFLHTFSVTHILFNMLMLWFIGSELETRWGKKFFLGFYFTTAIGAAVIYCLGTWIYYMFVPSTTALLVPVMGASGAIFGLLLAYGILFGERVIHFMMLFPMKAKYFVMILGAVEMSSLLTSDVNGGDVAYLAHLGGLVAGYLTLMGWTRIQRYQWARKTKKRNSKLRLVVDNDPPKPGEGPKYWN